jgi:hypothetical protein
VGLSTLAPDLAGDLCQPILASGREDDGAAVTCEGAGSGGANAG